MSTVTLAGARRQSTVERLTPKMLDSHVGSIVRDIMLRHKGEEIAVDMAWPSMVDKDTLAIMVYGGSVKFIPIKELMVRKGTLS